MSVSATERAPAVAPAVDAFLDMLRAERGAAGNTLDAYRRDLARWSAYCRAAGHDAAGADPAVVAAYLGDLHDSGYAQRSTRRHLSALRQFHRFLVVEGWRADDPTTHLASPKAARPLPRTLAEDEVDRLLLAARAVQGPRGLRLACIVELLYASGLRVSELVGLDLARVDCAEMLIRVRGKGGRERIVPMGTEAIAAFERYLAVRAVFLAAPVDRGFVFPSRARQGYLTRQRILQLLKELALEAGIPHERVSPHVLRHAFATHLLGHGMDLRVLQTLLGHADIATTEIYTHLDRTQLRATVDACHPLGRVRCGSDGDNIAVDG